jgi:CTP synthase (UTP-ammonia lyase)
MIPHVTGEVKNRLRELAVATKADVVFVEIGGTVGDVENAHYIEAMRQLAFEEGQRSVCFVALTYVLEPSILGEQKSKAAQLGIRRLLECGVQPHIIACRAQTPVTRKVREKIALFSNVPPERVFSMHDCESVYLIPELLRGAGYDKAVMEWLQLESAGRRGRGTAEPRAVVRLSDAACATRRARCRSGSPASTRRCAMRTRASSRRWSTPGGIWAARCRCTGSTRRS